MEGKRKCWYSIVRFSNNNTNGEVMNVGVILHSLGEESKLHYLLLNENTIKIKALSNSHTLPSIYKTYKDTLEYYLQNSIKNLVGAVGELAIASPQDNKFLEIMHKYHMNKNLYLTEPTFALTENLEGLFKVLFESYVGKGYLNERIKPESVKHSMKKILEEENLLNKKVIHNHSFSPIVGLDNVRVNIDFSFKNGVWNHIQTIPNLDSTTKDTEWFTKTKFMFENIDKEAKVHLLYRESDLRINKEMQGILNYFLHLSGKVQKIDFENQNKINSLISFIQTDAHDLTELLA
ncbi:DUF3037 domain-containing protein [Bacillus sp. 1P06AnD]|uniref:DUF3037 domain-containing protein n=1 Tax=Bacillus sp. 1P06AnD TaxID=3132208 RepID=UPI0039A0CA19